MDKQREIEQFRQNVLPEYLKLAEEQQRANEPPRCIQCGRVKPKRGVLFIQYKRGESVPRLRG